MPVIDDNDCIEFGPKSRTCPKWPVRVIGQQGLWRYVGTYGSSLSRNDAPIIIEVIGPYFPNSPERNGGRSRIFPLEKIKYAGKNAKPIDVLHVQTTAISEEAKRARRR